MVWILYHEEVRDVLIVAVESKTDGQLLIKPTWYLGPSQPSSLGWMTESGSRHPAG
jgi:hypothetical protein